MTDNNPAEEKSIVSELNFGAKTAKRVGWESWEFSVEAPHLVRVTNAAYGFEKDDHSYLVGVEDRDGLLVPSECGCKADRFREEYDCKHKVALATVGGPVVLQASVNFPTCDPDSKWSDASTVADKLRADGGTTTEGNEDELRPLDAVSHDECDCGNLPNDFPCADCYLQGEKELPE